MLGKYMSYGALLQKINDNKPLYLGIEIIRPMTDSVIQLDENNILRLFGIREAHLSEKELYRLSFTDFNNINNPKRIVRATSGDILGYTMNAPKKIEYNEDSSMQRIYNELKKLKYDLEKLGDYGIKIGNIDDNINGYTITDISSFKSSKINTTSENYQILTDYYIRHMSDMASDDLKYFIMNYIDSESSYITDYFDKLNISEYTKKSFEKKYRSISYK